MIIFDVGANNGGSCYHFANDPNNTVYAFEPTPHLIQTYLKNLVKTNYILIPKAVTNHNGKAQFNVSGVESDGWGCSSLYEFNDNLNTTWPGRHGFVITDVIEVECISMKSFIEENNIQRIDWLHCDTQGNDLVVLESFEEHIDKLIEGEIEVFAQNPLYKNINNSKENAIKFLEKNNFKILDIRSNYCHENEWNIRFKR